MAGLIGKLRRLEAELERRDHLRDESLIPTPERPMLVWFDLQETDGQVMCRCPSGDWVTVLLSRSAGSPEILDDRGRGAGIYFADDRVDPGRVEMDPAWCAERLVSPCAKLRRGGARG
jgi:hypothetical protein